MSPALRRTLDGLRARARKLRTAAFALDLAILAGSGLFALVLVGSGAGGEIVRGGAIAVVASALSWILVLDLVVPLSEIGKDDRVALLASRAARESLLAAVELARAPRDFSEELLEEHARCAVAVAVRAPPSVALPLGALRRRAIGAIVCVACGGSSATLWPSALARGGQSVMGPLWADSGPSAAADGPIVGDLSLEYVFPDYMTESPLVVPSTSGAISAPRGTTVRIRTRGLMPVRAGSIIIEQGRGQTASLPLEVRDDRSLEARMVVNGPGRYAFEIEPVGDEPVRERGWRPIRALADQRPVVTLTAPDGDLTVEASERVGFTWDVRDDHGLAELWAVVEIGDQHQLRRRVRSFDPAAQSASGEWALSLDEVRVAPGEAVSVRLEALDRDTVTGPNRGSSRTVTVRVASPASRHLAILEDQKILLDLVVTALAERLEHPVPEDAPEERFRIARAAHERVLAWIAGHREALMKDTLTSRELVGRIDAMGERLETLAAREWRLHGPVASRTRRLEVDREQVKELEDDALFIEDFLGRQRLDALAELGREVDASRERIADLLGRFARTRSEDLRRELLAQIAALETRVRELQARLGDMQRDVPGEFLNTDALEAMDLEGALRDLRESLAGDDVAAAQAALGRLTETMRELMAALEGNASAFRGERFAAEERARSELLDRVGDLERRQRDLSRLTRAVQERYRRRLAETMRSRIDPLVQRLLVRSRAAATALAGAEVSALAQSQREQMARAGHRVADLQASLEQGDLDEAAQMAERGLEGLEELDHLLSPPRSATRSAVAAVEAAIPELRAVRQELVRAMPDADQTLGEEDGGRLRRQGASQRTLSEDAARLERKLARPDSQPNLPFVLRDARRLLEEARAQMGQASDSLGRASPREAFDAQERALERLRRLRETLEEAGRASRLSEGMAMRQRPVRIPGPDDHRVPREFRREVLDAMRETAGDQEDEAVRRYYEELVR
ncbi:MAG: hypothetical protein HYY06_19655 [Deltaproteobacteria bacterium]|nr:hypothetical protein [Deltaproteobacteria bacterium]